jgi:hypothetical protein
VTRRYAPRMRRAGQLSPDEFWRHYGEVEDRVRANAGRLPSYGVAGWSGLKTLGHWGWEDDHLVTCGLTHGALDGSGPMVAVRTTVHDPRREVSFLRLAREGQPRDTADFSRRQREIDSEAGEQRRVLVEDTAVAFSTWRRHEGWYAAGNHDGLGLVLEGRDVSLEQVQLVRVDDLEPYLAGSRADLLARRGEA